MKRGLVVSNKDPREESHKEELERNQRKWEFRYNNQNRTIKKLEETISKLRKTVRDLRRKVRENKKDFF